MNIEVLANLIEATDLSTFRSLVTILIPLIGLKDVDYCDGPYDGGKDFQLAKMPGTGVRIGIQISTEKKWKAKLEKECKKLKSNFDTNVIYFISSRRMPEGSFSTVKEDVFKNMGVVINKYDNQAIATRLIHNNKIDEALSIMGINFKYEKTSQLKYLGPKNEAISSLLLFDGDSKDLRQRFFQSIIMSSLSRISDGANRVDLIKNVKSNFKIDDTQAVQLGSNIDRLLQSGELVSDSGVLRLAGPAFDKYTGLQKSTELELNILKTSFENKLAEISNENEIDPKTANLLLDNFLELVVYLSSKEYSNYDIACADNTAFTSIKAIIDSKFGEDKCTTIFKELSEFFASSDFCKHIACAKLYEAFLNTKSSHLINALGGTEGLNVYIDSSVFIPIICALLFEKVPDRFSQSGAALYQLISDHRFNAIVPHDYMEEVASHLIEACRDYKHIIDQDIDLSFSGNAFVSHYSKYKKGHDSLSFEDYVKIFGIRLGVISSDMTDTMFYSIRDKVTTELANIAQRYNFSVEKMSVEYFGQKVDRLKEFLRENSMNKPDVLIKHDARVITYLSGDYVKLGVVKLLCTWDKLHSMINPDGGDGYFVMHPIAIIDYLSLAKGDEGQCSLIHLLDFAAVQEERDLELSANIWDSIAKLESDKLSDAQLILSAKDFKNNYMTNHANAEYFAVKEIEEAWMAWKQRT
jgi:hypothetical protein